MTDIKNLKYYGCKTLCTFAQLAGIDFITLYEELMRQPQYQETVNRVKLFPDTLVA